MPVRPTCNSHFAVFKFAILSWIQAEPRSLLPFSDIHHLDGIPGTALQEGSLRSFACAKLAANAQIGIDLYAACRRMVLVGNPEHACVDRTVFDAGRRARAAG